MADERVVVLAGTRKGLFVFESDTKRRKWRSHGPYHKGWQINHAALDPRKPGRVFACAANAWWGSHLFIGRSVGRFWQMAEDPKLPRQVGRLKAWWHVAPGADDDPDEVWAGVEPAALMRSTDGGRSWRTVNGLNLHGSRKKWQPGGGGLILHTIHPDRGSGRMWAGISAAGVFVSKDKGATWDPANEGVRADFSPDPYPEVGTCPHKFHPHPENPKRMWQQHHYGVYRSDDGARRWRNVTRGLPSKFGFPLAIDPRDPDTAWVSPLESDNFRAYIHGKVAVWRTNDAGKSWQSSESGLPNQNAYTMAYREGLCTDGVDPVGVYLGTGSGGVFVSTDGGVTFRTIAEHLPPVVSVSAGVV